jgi:hypothetical protein
MGGVLVKRLICALLILVFLGVIPVVGYMLFTNASQYTGEIRDINENSNFDFQIA